MCACSWALVPFKDPCQMLRKVHWSIRCLPTPEILPASNTHQKDRKRYIIAKPLHNTNLKYNTALCREISLIQLWLVNTSHFFYHEGSIRLICCSATTAGVGDVLLRLQEGDKELMFYSFLMANLYSGLRKQPHHKRCLKFTEIPKQAKLDLRKEPGENISKHPEVPKASLRIWRPTVVVTERSQNSQIYGRDQLAEYYLWWLWPTSQIN